MIERIFPWKADSWNVYSKHHDSQYLHYLRYYFYSKFSWNNAEEMRALFWKKKQLLEVHFILHVQTNTSNITWTSKSFLWKKSAPIYSALFHEKKKIIRIFQAEIMQEPTVEKRCTWLHGPLMNKL